MAVLSYSRGLAGATAVSPFKARGLVDHPARGIMLMMAAMLVFSCMDGVSKLLTAELPPLQVVWGRFVFQVALIMPAVLLSRGRMLHTSHPVHQAARGLCMFGSAMIFTLALSFLPIAKATVIGFISPLFVTALSIPFLGEKVGRYRWAAVAVGFLGVLVVARPGGSGFHPAMMLPMASAFCWAMALIISRRMSSHEDPVTTLIYTGLVGLVVSSVLVPFVWVDMGLRVIALLAVLGAISLLGQYLLIRAFVAAPASTLAPFSYTQIVWSGLIGLLVFSTMPDHWTLIGSAIIASSGLYTWHREMLHHKMPTVPTTDAPEAMDADEVS